MNKYFLYLISVILFAGCAGIWNKSALAGDDDRSNILPRFKEGEPAYADPDYFDGRFRPVVGVHNFEVMRCNRTHPHTVHSKIVNYPDAGIENVGFTYNHAPMLCCWKEKFWILYPASRPHYTCRQQRKNNGK
jgi:hypothetical protein